MSANIGEYVKIDHALNYQTCNNSNANSVYFSMANYDRIMFIVDSAAVTGNVNIQIRQSTDNTVANSTTISTVSNANIQGNANTAATIEVRAPALDTANGYYYVGIRVTEVNTLNTAFSAVAIRTPARYNQASLLS